MTAPGSAPISLRRVELAAGLASLTVALALVMEGFFGLMNSACGVHFGDTTSGCSWASPPGYFVVLGVFLYALGLILVILGGLRRDRRARPVSPPGLPRP